MNTAGEVRGDKSNARILHRPRLRWLLDQFSVRYRDDRQVLTRRSKNVVAFYNQRRTAEQHIKEGKGAIKWTRLSCRTLTKRCPSSTS